MNQEKKLAKMLEEEDAAVIKALTDFLSEASVARYAIKNRDEIISKYFEVQDDWDGILYIHLKTPLWTFSHGYTLDIELSDTENLFEWIKAYSKRILYAHYGIDA